MSGLLALPEVIPSWAEDGDVFKPSDLEIAQGWLAGSIPPSRQRFNWVLKWLMQASRYSLQTGIPSWSPDEEYGNSYVQRNAKTYIALQPSTGKDPETEPLYWMRWGFSQTEIDSMISLGQGPGKIDLFARSTPPTGWLKANGAVVSRTAYANLFSAIGTTWGAGDGATTFQLPDLRGYFLRMWDDGRGVDVGRAFASTQQDALQGFAVKRTLYRDSSSPGTNVQSGSSGTSDGTMTLLPESDGVNGVPRIADETRSKNIALLGAIRY